MSQTFAGRPEVQAYIQELARSTNHFSADELERVFSTARFSQDVIDRMGRATNNRTWFQYEAPLLTQSRIDGGVAFMRTNAPALARAKQRYGVPPEIVTAMICVESDYGRAPLDFKAVESLATLAFGYPPRSAYFRKELTQFLLLCREEKWDPLQIPSSRDGGLGLAQFMPTSYRRIAIDFDGDGHRNLLTNPTDAIGSIANYLNLDRWHKTNAIIAVRAVATGTNYQAAVRQTFPILKKEEWRTIAQWQDMGVKPAIPAATHQLAALIQMQGEHAPELWMVYWNFNVITKYNHNPMYALTVDHLSQAIHHAAASAPAKTSAN